MKMILPFLAVCCFALAGVGCKSTGSTCSHDHGAKCCGTCDGAKKDCCGTCDKGEKKCCGKCDKAKAE